jgi:superfamily II DNA/RNA helicase
VKVSVRPEQPTIDTIDQAFIEVRHVDKLRALREVLARDEASRVLVFRRTKRGVDKLAKDLMRLGHDAGALHGDIPQRARERVLEGFRRGTVSTLVATNLAARGIHVEGIDHVVNFDLPEDPETYVHRVGRTGRAGEHGKAVTFVTETEQKDFQDLKRKARVPFVREHLALYAKSDRRASAARPEREETCEQVDFRAVSSGAIGRSRSSTRNRWPRSTRQAPRAQITRSPITAITT